MDFQSSLTSPGQFVTLYGTTPPRADAPEERVIRAATRLAARIAPLPVDGLVVYDVQDEDGRTTVPRPFPYLPTTDPRAYARSLRELLGKPMITYKCIAEMTEETWEPWLTEARTEYGVRYLSLVGLPTARGRVSSLPLPQAIKMAAHHPSDFTLGGVTIAERHGQGRSESARMLRSGQWLRLLHLAGGLRHRADDRATERLCARLRGDWRHAAPGDPHLHPVRSPENARLHPLARRNALR